MQPRDFIFFGRDEQERYYRELPNGNIGVTAEPTSLPESMEGWQEQTATWERNLVNFGVFRSITTSFIFQRTGAKILRYLFWQVAGVMAYFELLIARRNNNNGHDLWYKGNGNFLTFEDGTDDGVKIELNDGNLTELVKTNENTVVEIPVNVPEAIAIQWSGINLKSSTRYFVSNGDVTDDDELFGAHIIGLDIISSEIDVDLGSAFGTARVKFPDFYTNPSAVPNTGQYLFRSSIATTIRLRGDFEVNLYTPQVFLSQSFNALFQFYQGGDEAAAPVNVYSVSDFQVFNAPVGALNPNKTHRIVFDVQVALPAGTDVYFLAFNTNSLQDETTRYDYSVGDNNLMTVDYEGKFKDTEVKALEPFYVFSEIIKKITNGKYTAKSNFLQSDAVKNTLIVPGLALRGLPDAVLKTSLTDFFKSINVPFPAMQGVENDQYMIEDFNYAFQDVRIASLGVVSGENGERPVKSPFQEYIYSAINVGYPNRVIDDINGRQEYNTISRLTTPMTREEKVMDLTSVYRADPFGAEYQRGRWFQRETTQSEGDDDVWMISTVRTAPGIAILNRPEFDSITGVLSPETVFNIPLTPARCLRAHGSKIRGFMWPLDTQSLVFQTAGENKELVTVSGGVTIREAGDVVIGSLAPAVVLGVGATVVVNIPFSFMDIMENPYGYIDFVIDDKIYNAYIVSASQRPADDAPQTVEVMFKAGNDFKPFII